MDKSQEHESLVNELRNLPMNLPLDKKQKMLIEIQNDVKKLKKRRGWAMLTKAVAAAAAVIVLAFGFFQYEGSFMKQQPGTPPVPEQTETDQPQQQKSPKDLVAASYSTEQKAQIIEAAKKAGVKTPYIPEKIISGNTLTKIESGSEPILDLKYEDMSIQESPQAVTGGGNVLTRKEVTLKSGKPATLVTVKDKADTVSSGLLFSLNETYIAIWTDQSNELNLQSIAESLQPLQPQNQSSNSNVYVNDQYGFSFSLPESWKGYSIVSSTWEGLDPQGQNGETKVATGPIISIRHPKWTSQKPRQDIPIMVFTLDQWNSLTQGKFHIGAAPVNPRELGRNNRYVFALPARYNFAFPEGFEEVETILNGNPLQTQNK